jgi:hypothetical protein
LGAYGRLFKLRQHDRNTVAPHDAERWGIIPETLVLETEPVPVKVGRGHDVIHDEIRRNPPSRPFRSKVVRHKVPPVSATFDDQMITHFSVRGAYSGRKHIRAGFQTGVQ